MISSQYALRPSVPNSVPRARSASAPTPPAPKAPADTLDFKSVDTPVKAALLPTLEPSVQLGLAAGVLFTAMFSSQSPGAVPLVNIDVAMKNADKLVSASYAMDFKNNETPIAVSGSVDGQQSATKVDIDPKNMRATLNESFGNVHSTLTLGADASGQALKASGKMGDVDVDLSFSPISGADKNDIKGFHAEGRLGKQPYSLDTSLDVASVMKGSTAPTEMTARGKLGDQAIAKDYVMTMQQNGAGIVLHLQGSGTTAGVPQNVDARIEIIA